MAIEHFDVLVVGAGLSGIGAGVHLQKHCPGKRFAILEGRDNIGGTWDLFRYPGIRSDSDMYTLGYSFKPWEQAKAIADGPSILDYVQATAREHGIDRKIRFGHKVKRAAWSSDDATWTVEVEVTTLAPSAVPPVSGIQRANASPPPPVLAESKQLVRLRCNFLFMCSGYYSYDAGYTPQFAGIDSFAGRVVHPQKWTEDIDYAGKRVVVIGSGATAVTLVPELAKTAAHVTMLQRSPTWVVARPSEDALANRLRRWLPAKLAYGLTRWKRVLLGMYFYNLCQRNPGRVKDLLLGGVKAYLGPDYDVDKHFTPRYKPWEQRLCLVPDGDFFMAIRKKTASVVTDHIDSFTTTGLKLKSGTELPADLVVTATGLDLIVLGGLQLTVDGVAVDLSKTLTYKGLMFDGVPNLASAFGYTNASWTLKCDLSCEYVCRLLNQMDKSGLRQCTPRNTDATVSAEPWVNFSSGYFQRAIHKLPKQGSKLPWKLHQNYARDLMLLRYGKLDDGVLQFSNPQREALPQAA